MEYLKQAEKALEGPFKSFPDLPKEAREGLAKIWPWLAIIGGFLQAMAAWYLIRYVSNPDPYGVLEQFNIQRDAPGITLPVMLAIVVLVTEAILLFAAFPRLQAKKKSGWDLLFAVALLNLAYGLMSLFISGRGMGSLLGSLIGSAIAFYLLFQVREYFGGKNFSSNNKTKK